MVDNYKHCFSCVDERYGGLLSATFFHSRFSLFACASCSCSVLRASCFVLVRRARVGVRARFVLVFRASCFVMDQETSEEEAALVLNLSSGGDSSELSEVLDFTKSLVGSVNPYQPVPESTDGSLNRAPSTIANPITGGMRSV